MRKMLKVAAFAVAATTVSALALSAAAESYNAYIGFQTAPYSFRNAWNDATYGKDSGVFDKVVVWGGNDPETYPDYADNFVDDIAGAGSAGYFA